MIAKEAWSYVEDPIEDSMIALMQKRNEAGDEAGMVQVHDALQVYSRVRGKMIDALSQHKIFPPVGTGSATLMEPEEMIHATQQS